MRKNMNNSPWCDRHDILIKYISEINDGESTHNGKLDVLSARGSLTRYASEIINTWYFVNIHIQLYHTDTE